MDDLEARVRAIEERNARVTFDKSWEISWTRRGLISIVIYICGFILLNMVGHEDAWKHAFVPVIAYLLSTLSLPTAKRIWVERKHRDSGNVTLH